MEQPLFQRLASSCIAAKHERMKIDPTWEYQHLFARPLPKREQQSLLTVCSCINAPIVITEKRRQGQAGLRFQACKVSAPASKACTLSIEHKSRSIFIRACFAAVQLEAGLWNRGCSVNISTFYKNRQEKYFKSNQTHYISFFFLFLHRTIF